MPVTTDYSIPITHDTPTVPADVASSIGVTTEQQAAATSAFSGAVEEFGRNAASDLSSGRFESGTDAVRGNADSAIANGINSAFGLGGTGVGSSAWQSSKYAEDLIKYAPKNRFIFKVKFVFNPPYGNADTEFSYVVRNIDKPTVTFEYDDINMYNFKTKVLRTIQHEPLNMMFHDDIQNRVLDFFNFYRTAHSPVSNMTVDQIAVMEENGMSFQDPADVNDKGNPNTPYAAASGVLMNNTKNLLKYIELSQVYAHGSRVNRFFFINPKILNFDFDNVDHENSDGNALTCAFAYDSLYVEDDTAPKGTPSPLWANSDVMGNDENANPKLELPNAVGGASHGGKKNPTAAAATTGSLFGDLAVGVGGAWLSNKAAETINSKVGGSKFGGLFQNSAGAISGALGGLTAGLIGQGVEATKSGIGSTVDFFSSDDEPADGETPPETPPEEGTNG